MQDISKVHKTGFPEKQLEEIEIFFSEGNAAVITSLTLPNGEWTDLERIEITAGFNNIPASVNTTIVHRKDLIASPTGWSARVRLSSGVLYSVAIEANSNNTATVINTGSGVGLKSVIGYKKRYAVENNSVIIPVNGGLNVAVNSRYEVNLPAEFYEADGSVKKGVQVRAEVYIAGTNYTGWAEAETGHMYNSSNGQHYNYGVKAFILGNRTVVDTGGYGTAAANKYILYPQKANPWGVSSHVTQAPCRVVATLNDAYQIQKYELHSMSADAELDGVVLYDGERVANGGDVPLSEDILANEYKEIRVYGAFTYTNVAEYSDVLILSPEELLSNYRHEVLDRTDAGSSTAAAAIYIDGELSTGTSLRVSASNSFFTSAGVYKVVGYKKRYTSVNQSTIIHVNSGNNVGVNQRHIVALPAEFHELNDVSQPIKSGVTVRAEIYNDGSKGGDIGWGNTQNYSSSGGARFVVATVLGTSVVVQTGSLGLCERYPIYSGHPFGTLSDHITSAQCRIVVTLNDIIPLVDFESAGLYADSLQLSGTNSSTVVEELESLNATKLDTDQFSLANAPDVSIPVNTAGIMYTLGDGLMRLAPLQKNEDFERSDAIVETDTQRVFTNPETLQQIDFDVFDVNGAGLTVDTTGITIVSASTDWSLLGTVKFATTCRQGGAGDVNASYPLTVRTALLINGMESSAYVDSVMTQDSTVIVKANELTSDDLALADGDEVSLGIYFLNRNAVNVNDKITVDTGSYILVETVSDGITEYGIPTRYLSQKHYKAYDTSVTPQTVSALDIGTLIQMLGSSSNNPSLFADGNGRHVIKSDGGIRVKRIAVTIPFVKIGGGSATGSVLVTGVVEYSSDSTNGIDGTWAQVSDPTVPNSFPYNIGNDGVGTAKFDGVVNLAQKGFYRVSIFAKNTGGGTVQVPIPVTTNYNTFVGHQMAYIDITEEAAR